MSSREKITLSIEADLNRRLHALAFVTKRTRSQIVADAFARQLADLSDPQRRDFETALRLGWS